MKQRSITVSKIEAAQRQLDSAISLWFADGDEVSIHTLACASHQIIHDINRKNCGRDLIFDSLLIKDEFLPEFNRLVRAAMTFFKHAERDTAASIEFNPEFSEYFVLFSIVGLEQLGIPKTPAENCFINWICFHKPKYLTAKGKRTFADPDRLQDIQKIRDIQKKDFYDAYMLVLKAR
jgi:hypothetical protein